MNKNISIFKKYLDRFFPKLSTLIEKINEKRGNTLTYLHKDTSILKKTFSPDNKWESGSVNSQYVAADFVAMDSPLPLKSRPTVHTGNGRLPKSGIARVLIESEITELQVMEAQGGNAQRIARVLADNAVTCNAGLDELMEYAFLYGFSNGFVALPDEDHPDQLMRLKYGYLNENTFGTAELGVITIGDFRRVFEKAESDQNTIIKVWIAKSAYDALRKTREARELVADMEDRVYTDDSILPIPGSNKFNQAMEDEFGITFQIINRTVKFEKNGMPNNVKPWNPNRVIFACNEQVGEFMYGRLAEDRNRVAGVNYNLIDDFKLISEYSTNEPSLVEKTAGQCIAAPIIEDVDQLYILDSTLSQEVDPDEEEDVADTYVTINKKRYSKSAVIEALKALGVSISATATDAQVIKAVNELSEEVEEEFMAGLEDVPYTYSAVATDDMYTAVADPSGQNPYEKGWYTKSGSTYTQVGSSVTTPANGTTYYAGKSPKAEGWYKKNASNKYVKATETTLTASTTYYTRS